MSSTVTIGFLDRSRVCIEAEFTPPIADDERHELLVHAALLTGRAFASLTPDRQRAFARVLREWVAAGFETCPLQISDGDPMACPHRFASTFLAPAREYALATVGCGAEAGGIDYFLPMAAAAYLRYVADTDADQEELLKPALALCAAVAIHPITVANHFEMAAASLPRGGPIIDRTVPQQELPFSQGAPALPPPVIEDGGVGSSHHLRESRLSLIVSACLAAALIVLGVHYLSTRGPGGVDEPATVRVPAAPKTPPQQSEDAARAHDGAPESTEGGAPSAPAIRHSGETRGPGLDSGVLPHDGTKKAPVAAPHSPAKPLSPKARAYVRKVRDLAENSLAQVEVMLTVVDRAGAASEESTDALEYGIRQLRAWRRQFAELSPPGTRMRQHREVGMALKELGGLAGLMRSPQSKTPTGAIRDRLSALHASLEKVLSGDDGF